MPLGLYVVRQHAGMLAGMHTSEKVSRIESADLHGLSRPNEVFDRFPNLQFWPTTLFFHFDHPNFPRIATPIFGPHSQPRVDRMGGTWRFNRFPRWFWTQDSFFSRESKFSDDRLSDVRSSLSISPIFPSAHEKKQNISSIFSLKRGEKMSWKSKNRPKKMNLGWNPRIW